MNLKIVFFGTPEFAVASLDRLVKDGCDVAAVVTMPDKRAGRGHKIIESDVKKYTVQAGLPVLQPERLKDPAFIEELRAIGADLFIVIAFRMLPEAVWAMPPLGTFNLHASLLPRYRGAAPLNWAVINGDTKTGVTTFFLKHEIDTGDIIQQRESPIGPDDTVGDVHDRLMALGAEMVSDTVRAISEGGVETTPQPEGEYLPAPKIFKETCRLDFGGTAADVRNKVRGLSPYPAAWCVYREERTPDAEHEMKVYSTRVGEEHDTAPGTIRIGKDTIEVACADRWLEITELQPAGKKRMGAADFLRGNTPVAIN